MKVFKFLPPYKSNGKTNFPEAQKRTGVYIIKKDNKIIYVGYSASNLYKTLFRHFQTWNDRQQPDRVSYKNDLKNSKFLVRVIYCTPKRAAALEKALILKHQPADNKLKYEAYINEAPANEKKYINNINDVYENAEILKTAPF